jgi:hypothetical protein
MLSKARRICFLTATLAGTLIQANAANIVVRKLLG